MISLDKLPVWEKGRLQVVIEAPRGSRNKYKYDPASGQVRLDKVLPVGASFPFDFGFVPSTHGEDGDPIDVLVVMEEPVFPGCVVTALPIGVIEAEQTENGKTIRNDRLIAVLDTERNPAVIQSLDALGNETLGAIEQFFIGYNLTEGRKFKPIGRHGPKKAKKLLGKGE